MTGDGAAAPKFWRGIMCLLLVSGLTVGADIGTSHANPASHGIKRHPSVMSAIYRDRRLLTLADDGIIRAWREGANVGVPVKTPKKVVSFCAADGQLYLVTVDDVRKRVVVWRGNPGSWSQVLQFAGGGKDRFLALDCSGPDPVLLTTSSIRFLKSGRKIALDQHKLALMGRFNTLQHGGYLYVGANAGEWGGGLHRFPLTNGAGEVGDAAGPVTLCGSQLDVACHPLTGLAPDPARPDCILATTGLAHLMLSRGSVLRICGTDITLAYTKPLAFGPTWQVDPASPAAKTRSVPFYSLGKNSKGTWATGVDGIYRFANGGLPAFTAFPQELQLPASGIDWSNPDFVLVATSMNQRHSPSGDSLILVPR